MAGEPDDTSAVEQPGVNMQGVNMQGVNMQGVNMQGMSLMGFEVTGATLYGSSLSRLRVVDGELVADYNWGTLRGTALTGVRLMARVRDDDGATEHVAFRIARVAPELAAYDPTGSGRTYLYTLEQWIEDSCTWKPACPIDQDGQRVAIPLAATWDESGDRSVSPELFTFGCTMGVLAKCYRWGYRPWLGGFGGANFTALHQTCTRLARADYCGDGTPHTQDGTLVNVWDVLPAPGPIQHRGAQPPAAMTFEAAWDPDGAVCVSHLRWQDAKVRAVAELCPDRFGPSTVCHVYGHFPTALMFNDSVPGTSN